MDATAFLKEFLDTNLQIAPANCKVIFPTAGFKQMGCLNDKSVHSWYNKYVWKSFDTQEEEYANYSQTDIAESVGVITGIIEQEAALLGGTEKVFVGGHS